MAGIAAIASIVGTVVSAVGTIAAGQSQRRMAEYQAKGLDIKAKEEFAAGQRDALEYARRLKMAQSRVQAVSAAGGLGATDTTVLDLQGDLAEHGTLQSQMAQYGGASRAQGTREQAQGLRVSGRAAETGSYFNAAGTILGGFSSMYDSYGKGIFGTSTGAGGGYGAMGKVYGFG